MSNSGQALRKAQDLLRDSIEEAVNRKTSEDYQYSQENLERYK